MGENNEEDDTLYAVHVQWEEENGNFELDDAGAYWHQFDIQKPWSRAGQAL